MEDLATSREVAAYLKVHPGTMDQWAHQGKGPAYTKVGGRRRYLWSDVQRWLDSRKVSR